MITEGLLLSGGVYLYKWLGDKPKRYMAREFNKVMVATGTKDKEDNTFQVLDVEEKDYGVKCLISIPKGLSLENLISKSQVMQDNWGCLVEINKTKWSSYATMHIIWEDVAKFKFEPVECQSHLIWIGKDIKGKDYFLDLNKDPHLLIGGTTGAGKSFLLSSILTNYILSNSNNCEMYLSQTVKGDVGAFANCSCVKNVAMNMLAVELSLKEVCDELDRRSNIMTANGIKNITQWNQHYPNKSFKRIIYVLEELSFFMESNCWEYILKICKAGRSAGCHAVGLVQRSTISNLPSDCKSQMTRLTLRQRSSLDSTNIINIPDAKDLGPQECILDSNEGIIHLKTAWVDEDFYILHKYLPSIAIPKKIPTIPKFTKEKVKDVVTNIVDTIIEPKPTLKSIEKPTFNNGKRKGVIPLRRKSENDK